MDLVEVNGASRYGRTCYPVYSGYSRHIAAEGACCNRAAPGTAYTGGASAGADRSGYRREFSIEMLAQASDQDEETVMYGLDELWRRHLMRVQDVAAYDFSLVGIRAVAYDDFTPPRRRAFHLRVAQALEQLLQDDLDAFSSQIAAPLEHKPILTRVLIPVRHDVWCRASAYSGWPDCLCAGRSTWKTPSKWRLDGEQPGKAHL